MTRGYFAGPIADKVHSWKTRVQMLLARIVGSNSHIDYVGRVVDAGSGESTRTTDRVGFGEWLSMPQDGENFVGIVYDSRSIDPAYAFSAPRLENQRVMPNSAEYINEPGILIGILIVGTWSDSLGARHEIPRGIISVGCGAFKMDDDRIRKFHLDDNGDIKLHYFPQINASAGRFGAPLLRSITQKLSARMSEIEARRLDVLLRSLEWNRTFGGLRD